MSSIWCETSAAPIGSDEIAGALGRTWDLVVVGGGIVGLLSALRARERGLDVCLLDAGRIGEGTTAHSTVKVTSGHGAVLSAIASRQGDQAAVAYQRANDSGFASLSQLVSTLPDDVGWAPQEHVVYASKPSELKQLRTTVRLATRAGSTLSRVPSPQWAVAEAWSWLDSALVQPLALARSLGRLLQSMGVPIIEGARVRHVKDGGAAPRTLIEGGGEIRSRDVLIATHSPVHDPDVVTMRTEYFRHACIAVRLASAEVPASYAVEGLSTRPVTHGDGTPGAVLVGQSKRVGSMAATDWTNLETWAYRNLGATGTTHRWGAQDPCGLDLLPYVGRTRRERHVLIVTGLNAWGFTNAAVIAQWLADVLADESPEAQEEYAVPWDARRLDVTRLLKSGAPYLAWVAGSEVGDTVRAMTKRQPLAPGEGHVVGTVLHPVAECVTGEGARYRVSARCTHMGCLVRWNRDEVSWDCPCHGSRFAPDGSVLEGPADKPLDPL